jgi:hypothetical protein
MQDRRRPIGILVLLSFFMLLSGLVGCFGKKADPLPEQAPKPAVKIIKKEAVIKDKELQTLSRYFAQADAIHREAWRVMTGIKLPASKTPFGKLQRAALSAQNIKLTNKSLFSCDRFVMKRDVLNKTGIPQKAEVFEKCSEKSAARKIAYWSYERNEVVKITFYADQLQEVLGVGATIMNRIIECELRGNANEVLQSFTCSKWAQDKSAEEMIRLDTYTYKKEDKDLLSLKGKVYVNLSEARKIEAVVPLRGKIQVVETELYAPEEEAKPVVDTKGPVAPPGQAGQTVKPLPASPSARPKEDLHESGEIAQPILAPGSQLESNMKQLGAEIPKEPDDPHRVGSPASQLGLPDPAEVEEKQQQQEYERQQQQEQGDDGSNGDQSEQQGSAEQDQQQQADPTHTEQQQWQQR